MKTTLPLLLILLLPNYLLAQEKYIKINLNKTVYLFQNKKTCLKKTGEPLEGNYAIKINSWQTETTTFRDGLKNGETKIYRGKKLSETGMHQNDLREGIWQYFDENGGIRKHTNYKNGLREGKETIYNAGKIIETINYKNNHKDSKRSGCGN